MHQCVNSLFCPAHGCTNSRFIIAELQNPRTREHVFLGSVWWPRTECRPVRNKGVLDLTSRDGRWLVSAASDVAAATVISAGPVSPRSLVSCLFPVLSLSSSFSLSLLFHPFLQSFLLFLLLSFVGLSCKCSCWPPILVVLRSLPKSNKHSFLVVSFVVGVRASWGTCCGSSFPFLPQIPRVSKRGILQMAPNFGLPTPWRFLSSPSRLAGFVCCNRWVAFVAWFFFPVQLFLHSSAVPCCLKPHLPFPVSCSLSLSICLCLLLSLCPVARRLVRLVFLV